LYAWDSEFSSRLWPIARAVAAAIVCFSVWAGSARAATPIKVDPGEQLASVACPALNECVAVDYDGDEVTFNPTAPGTPTPHPVASATAPGLLAVACPLSTQCTALSEDGHHIYTFNPKSVGTPAAHEVDAQDGQAITCASSGQCTVVDFDGGINSGEVTFVPTSPGSPTRHVISSSGAANPASVACPSADQCTMVATSQQEFTFNPNAFATPVPEGFGGTASPVSVSCPATDECTAVNIAGQEATFSPKGQAVYGVADLEGDSSLASVACPSATQCTAVDTAGEEISFDPQAAGSPTPVDVDGDGNPSSIACPSTAQCTAVDSNGYEVTFSPSLAPPTVSTATMLSDGQGWPLASYVGQQANGYVATFSDSNPSDVPADFLAQIQWGDGSGGNIGTITHALSQVNPGGPVSNEFFIQAGHTYSSEPNQDCLSGDPFDCYPITITITDVANPKIQPLAITSYAIVGTPNTGFSRNKQIAIGAAGVCVASLGLLFFDGPGAVASAVICASAGLGAAIATSDPVDSNAAQIALPGREPKLPRLRCLYGLRGRSCRQVERAEKALMSASYSGVPIEQALIVTTDRLNYARDHHLKNDAALQSAVLDLYSGGLSKAIARTRKGYLQLLRAIRATRLPISRLSRNAVRRAESLRIPSSVVKLMKTQGLSRRAATKLLRRELRHVLASKASRSLSSLAPTVPPKLKKAYTSFSALQLSLVLQALGTQGAIAPVKLRTLEPWVTALLAARTSAARRAAAKQLRAAVKAELSGGNRDLLTLAAAAF
jgi:hypothetical protein